MILAQVLTAMVRMHSSPEASICIFETSLGILDRASPPERQGSKQAQEIGQMQGLKCIYIYIYIYLYLNIICRAFFDRGLRLQLFDFIMV